jgi:FG-GAP repeat
MATKNMNSPSSLTKYFVWRRLTVLSVIAVAAVTGCGSGSPTVPVRTQVAKLMAHDGEMGDSFGNSVAISGDTAIVGAWFDDDNGEDSGSAYIFERNANGIWTQQAKLLPDDGATFDTFGRSVAISGDIAIVGIKRCDGNGANSGSAYVFERDEAGRWAQQTQLLANDRSTTSSFGMSVAISGDTAVIGALGVSPELDSAYVFVRDEGGVWSQQAKLIASDGEIDDFFGYSVAINDDTIIVSAPYDNNLSGEMAGAVYVFIRDANTMWTQQAKLLPSGAFKGVVTDAFGYSIAISGDTVIAGASLDDDSWGNAGAAHVFVRDETGAWTKQAKLLASDASDGDRFGSSVAINGNTALVGATGEGNHRGKTPSSAYIFVRNASGVWEQQTKLIPTDGERGDSFGRSVALSDDTALVGADAFNRNIPNCCSGSAYIFELP